MTIFTKYIDIRTAIFRNTSIFNKFKLYKSIIPKYKSILPKDTLKLGFAQIQHKNTNDADRSECFGLGVLP